MKPLHYHTRTLEYLLALQDAPSISAAAEELGITQSALSQAVAALERRWGVKLLEKDGRHRVPTEAGRIVTEFARDCMERGDDLRARLEMHARGHGGALRVGMTDAANLYLLPQTLARFRQRYAAVTLSIVVADSHTLWARLAEHELDLAFTTGPGSGMAAETIMSEPLYLYLPEGGKRNTTPWALYPPGSETRKRIDRGLERAGIVPRAILESSNPQVLAQMVRLGLACAVLPDQPELRPRRAERIASRHLVAVRRRSAPPDARADELIAMAREAHARRRAGP